MSFVSYAQNFEDVTLWRALKHVDSGFYIDVGAWSPDIDSVTRAFYERGWQGINIEPNPQYHKQLQKSRVRDQNLCLAISDTEDVLTMNFLSNPGLSTLDDTIAHQHELSGWALNRQEVQVTTLAKLWQQHVPDSQDVHFLKIDVEGFEQAVLEGNDWKKNRPWVVVVEATMPMSQVESHDAWEHILLSADYKFAYADGLNRFYLAAEQANLLPAFKYPPNVFDDFVLDSQLRSETHATEANARSTECEVRTSKAEARASEAEARATQAELRASTAETRTAQVELRASEAETRTTQAELRASQAEALVTNLLHSTSWRITAPLRALKRIAISLIKQPVHCIKYLAHLVAVTMIRSVLKHPLLCLKLTERIKRFPKLFAYLRQLATHHQILTISAGGTNDYKSTMINVENVAEVDLSLLTPRARNIYNDLKQAIATEGKD